MFGGKGYEVEYGRSNSGIFEVGGAQRLKLQKRESVRFM